MKYYLVAESGRQTAFKITTAKLLDSLDQLLDQEVEAFKTSNKIYTVLIETHLLNTIGRYKIYVAELNSKAKKLSQDTWQDIVQDYIKRNKEYLLECEKIGNKLRGNSASS